MVLNKKIRKVYQRCGIIHICHKGQLWANKDKTTVSCGDTIFVGAGENCLLVFKYENDIKHFECWHPTIIGKKKHKKETQKEKCFAPTPVAKQSITIENDESSCDFTNDAKQCIAERKARVPAHVRKAINIRMTRIFAAKPEAYET